MQGIELRWAGLLVAVGLVLGLLAGCSDDSSVRAVGSGASPSIASPSIIVEPSATAVPTSASATTLASATATTPPITSPTINTPTPSPIVNRKSEIENSPTPTPTPGPVAKDASLTTSGCGRPTDIKPGTSVAAKVIARPTVARNQNQRDYRIYLPASYKPDAPTALVLIFHGYSGDAAGMEGYSGFDRTADKHNFIAVYPQGLINDDKQTFWASIGRYDYNIDEAVFVGDLLDKLQGELCVDASQIYATGFSNGGAVSYYLACTLASRIAAFAPVAGNYFAITQGCAPSRPVPILEIHGDADKVVPYQGRATQQGSYWPLTSVGQWLQEWVRRDGCAANAATILEDKTVVGTQWNGCKGGATVIHYRLIGGEHTWPGLIGAREVNEVIWDFLQAHPLP